MSNAPPNWVFSTFSFIGFVMCMIPLTWHLQAMNTGTVMYMIWNGLGCLNFFINSIMFNGSVENVAPIWCDISTRFSIGQSVAVPVAALCINRRLYLISSSNTVMTTKAEKRRSVMVDLAICLGIPILQMICQYVVSGHRFDIYEDVGCYQYTWNTPAAFPLVTMWPVVIGVISAVYASLSIRAFVRRRAQFKELLSGHRINANRYFRLMTIAGINIITVTPLGIFFLVFNATAHKVSPWVSWSDTHFNYSKVVQYPALLWRYNSGVEASLELGRWLVVLEAVLFFGLFGFAEEAMKNYKVALDTLSKKTGIMSTSGSETLTSSNGGEKSKRGIFSWGGSKTDSSAVMPVFVKRDVRHDRDRPDSFVSDSFTNMTGTYSFDEKNGVIPGLTLNDVGGALKSDDPPSPSSSSSSTFEMDVATVPRV